jgi:hypothetical protein
MVELARIKVSDLRFQMGQVPFKRSELHGLEIDELWNFVNDEDIESVRRAMDHLFAAGHVRQPSNPIDQCLAQPSTINLRKIGRDTWAL